MFVRDHMSKKRMSQIQVYSTRPRVSPFESTLESTHWRATRGLARPAALPFGIARADSFSQIGILVIFF